jgi:hypothetical protein
MNCANHNQTPAAAYCRTCGKPLCEMCKRDVRGVIYCEDCLASRVQDTIPPQAAAGTQPPPPPIGAAPQVKTVVVTQDAPSVGLATFLGFIPGVGAMYNSQFMKAFVHILIFATLVAAADRVDIFGLFVAAFMFYMVMDANRTAKARLLGEPLPDYLGINALTGTESAARMRPGQVVNTATEKMDAYGRKNKGPLAAIILIGLGTLLLLGNFGLFDFHWVHNMWPVLLILLGAWIGWQRLERGGNLTDLMGPVVLVTVGVLFLLDNVSWHLRFHNTWPILLIVIGGMKVIQMSAPMRPMNGEMAPPPASPAAENPSEPTEVHHG